MLKKNGKKKPSKRVKCKSCNSMVEINSEDIEEVAGSKVASCPLCYQDIVFKK